MNQSWHSPPASYILNRGWIDRSSQRVPTYKEITNTKGKRKPKKDSSDHVHSDSDKSDNDVQKETKIDDQLPEVDDSFDDLADTFESSYNFRFEEPWVQRSFICSSQKNIHALFLPVTRLSSSRSPVICLLWSGGRIPHGKKLVKGGNSERRKKSKGRRRRSSDSRGSR
jgi:hypothetical protein